MRRVGKGPLSRTWALAAVLMVLGGSAGCGGEGTGAPEAARSKGGAQRETFPDPDVRLDAEGLRKALPDLQDMPIGWKIGVTPLSVREVPPAKRCTDGNTRNCLPWSRRGSVQYKAPGDTGSVHIDLFAFHDRTTAGTDFKSGTRPGSYGSRPMSMPPVGNESEAHALPRAPYASPSLSITVRVGTAMAHMVYQDADKQPDSAKILLSLARMQAKRLLEVEQGRTPTATAG